MASIDYNDERFSKVTNEKNAAINQSNSTYDSLINDSQSYYDNLINQSKEWADKQAEIQNQQTDFAIEKIEQQKAKAEKDYVKEQKGAYQDYMKQTNAYGSNMQAAGQQGLGGSGWSETIQGGFYNTYQNRYAQARESFNEITMNYNNNIKEAQLQNSSAIATIYAEAQAKQLELALQNFTVIKDLTINKQNAYMAIDSEYNDRWRAVESQINTENALAEQIRQAKADEAYKQQVLALEKEQFNWQKAQASASRSSGGSSGGSGGGGGNSEPVQIKQEEKVPVTKEKDGSKQVYTQTLNAAGLLARSGNKRGAESLIAMARSRNQISQSQAAKMLKQLGIK